MTTPETRSAIVARNIRQLRKARGWTAQQLAEQAPPLSRQAISRIENGDRGVSLDDAYALAEVFGVTVDQLATATACEVCHGCPPSGFACLACGTGAAS